MSAFEKPAPRFRLVATQYSDDLPAVAAREMGNANRWPELVWINRLVPPYITDDVRRVAPGVLQTGSLIKVPAPVGLFSNAPDTGRVYERDAALVNRQLAVGEDGDLSVLSGASNLRQQLAHRVITPKGQALRHPDYGCMIWLLLGRASHAVGSLMGAKYVQAALAADYRVSNVTFSRATVDFDAIKIKAQAEAVEGGVVDVEITG